SQVQRRRSRRDRDGLPYLAESRETPFERRDIFSLSQLARYEDTLDGLLFFAPHERGSNRYHQILFKVREIKKHDEAKRSCSVDHVGRKIKLVPGKLLADHQAREVIKYK